MTTPRILRTFVAVLALAVSGFAALSTASPAGAATECGKKVLADWFDNGRIDRLYPLNCYEEAIDAIPDDLRDYADAEDVITRALQAALRGDLAPGGADPSPNDDGGDPGAPGPSGGNNGNGGSGGDGLRAAARKQLRTSTRQARPRCRFPCSCWEECRSPCSPPAGSDISRAAGAQPTPALRTTSTLSRKPLAASGRKLMTGTMSASCVYAHLQGFLRRHLPSGSLPTIPCPLA